MSDDLQVARLQLLAAALELDVDDLSGRARPRVRAAKLELDEAAKRIVALLAERDGLKAMVDEDRDANRAFNLAVEWQRRAEASNAALADALGLLREVHYVLASDARDSSYMTHLKDMDGWAERRDAFLAKHGPSP